MSLSTPATVMSWRKKGACTVGTSQYRSVTDCVGSCIDNIAILSMVLVCMNFEMYRACIRFC